MKLFDRLRSSPIGANWDDIPVIDGSVIQERIDELPDDAPHATAADYGVVAPPFPMFFVEATTYSAHPDEKGMLVSRGVMFFSWDSFKEGGPPPRYMHHLNLRDNTRWFLLGWAYMYCDGLYFATAGCVVLQIDDEGQLLDDTTALRIATDPKYPPPSGAYIMPDENVAKYMPFALTTISALHRRCEVEKIKPNRQQHRHAQRAGSRHGATEYYVVKVKPGAVRKVSDIAIPAPRGTRGDMPETKVIGHFKYYHPDRPRFGRPGEHGAFWIDPYTYGESSIGKIRKDYKIEDALPGN